MTNMNTLKSAIGQARQKPLTLDTVATHIPAPSPSLMRALAVERGEIMPDPILREKWANDEWAAWDVRIAGFGMGTLHWYATHRKPFTAYHSGMTQEFMTREGALQWFVRIYSVMSKP